MFIEFCQNLTVTWIIKQPYQSTNFSMRFSPYNHSYITKYFDICYIALITFINQCHKLIEYFTNKKAVNNSAFNINRIYPSVSTPQTHTIVHSWLGKTWFFKMPDCQISNSIVDLLYVYWFFKNLTKFKIHVCLEQL